MSGAGQLTAVPKFTASAISNQTAAGTIAAQSSLTLGARSSLTGVAVSTIYPQLIRIAITLSAGSGSVGAYGGFLANASSNLNANGLLNGQMIMIHNAILTSEPLRRATQDGSPRITSTGDFRTVFSGVNSAFSTMDPVATTIAFNGKTFSHRDGSYKQTDIRVKRNGVWVLPKAYVKHNGTWKRVY